MHCAGPQVTRAYLGGPVNLRVGNIEFLFSHSGLRRDGIKTSRSHPLNSRQENGVLRPSWAPSLILEKIGFLI